MFATGVPALITVSREIRNFKHDYECTRAEWKQEISEVHKSILISLEQQPEKVANKIRERFEINGAVAISREDVRSCICEVLRMDAGPMADIRDALRKLQKSQEGNAQIATVPSTAEDTAVVSAHNPACIHTWLHSDHLHMVPEEFIFPSFYVSTMWQLWLFCDSVHKICPYRCISTTHDLTTQHSKVNFSRCKKVMNKLVEFAVVKGMITSVKDITKENEQEIFEFGYNELVRQLYEHFPPRPGSVNINTIANRMIKAKM